MAKKGARRVSPRGKIQTIEDRQETRAVEQASRGAAAPAGEDREINRTDLIRLAIANHPGADNAELRRVLRQEGAVVSVALIQQVRRQTKGGGPQSVREGRPKGERGRKDSTSALTRSRNAAID